MPTDTHLSQRPYVSRRKRHRLTEPAPLLGNKSILVVLGMLAAALLASLGVIACGVVGG